jgi:hypothetical protein
MRTDFSHGNDIPREEASEESSLSYAFIPQEIRRIVEAECKRIMEGFDGLGLATVILILQTVSFNVVYANMDEENRMPLMETWPMGAKAMFAKWDKQ